MDNGKENENYYSIMGHMYVYMYIHTSPLEVRVYPPRKSDGIPQKMKTVETEICLKELSGGSMRIGYIGFRI